MPHQRVIIVVATVTLAVAALLTGGLRLLADAQAAGNIPEMMSYQGYATDSGGAAESSSPSAVEMLETRLRLPDGRTTTSSPFLNTPAAIWPAYPRKS